MELQSSVEIEDWAMAVVYDRKTGDIVHTHQSVTVKGGRAPGDKALQRDALAHAADARGAQQKKGWAVLRVDPRRLKVDAHYRVNPETEKLETVRRRKRSR